MFLSKNSMIANNLTDFVFDDCLALKIVNYSVTIILLLIYRSPSLSNEHSIQLIDQMNLYLESLPSDYSIIIVGDLNLPNVDWSEGIVHAPVNTQNSFLNMQIKFLEMFQTNNLHWCIDSSTYTRVKSVGGVTHKSTLDQIALSDLNLLRDLKVLPPIGKSDHVGLLVMLNIRTDNRLVKSKMRQWGKIKSSEIISHGNSIVWDAVGLSAEVMWNRIYANLISITDIVPVKTVSHVSKFRTNNTVKKDIPAMAYLIHGHICHI